MRVVGSVNCSSARGETQGVNCRVGSGCRVGIQIHICGGGCDVSIRRNFTESEIPRGVELEGARAYTGRRGTGGDEVELVGVGVSGSPAAEVGGEGGSGFGVNVGERAVDDGLPMGCSVEVEMMADEIEWEGGGGKERTSHRYR